ncbi:MAG TPA: CRTAC1 family protein [Bryobacteraceae bacterium]|nr:CRTAC1 family protein [Bryobacteraceae bacterium]
MRFVDMAKQAGLTARNVSGGELRKKYIIGMNGSGIAFIDYNNDGYVDLFVVNGSRFESAANEPPPTNHLYRNNGDGTFTDVTREAGVASPGWGEGVCAGDYNNDGWDDLFVTYYGRNKLYRNNGNGTFTDVAEGAGLAGAEGRWNSGCAFVDYDRDGKLDLFVANYIDPGLAFSGIPKAGSGEFCSYKGIPIACGPRGLKPGVNYLYRNKGDGTFADVSESSGIRKTEGHYALGVLTLDYDNDGWPDIYVACDSAASILYHNRHDGTFEDVGLASGTAFNEDGEPQAGMGLATADYDHDGFLDIVKTNFSDDSPNLYHNNGNGTFSDRVFDAGLGRLRNYLGWGAVFLDYDNDGWSDILLVNGHLTPEIDAAGSDSHYRQPKALFHNLRNGRFQDVSAQSGPAFAELHSSRGAAAADILNDGRISIAVNELNEPPSLLVPQAVAMGHWIGIKTIGVKSNRDAIGARVEVRAGGLLQIDEVRSGGSYLSQNDLRLHFGLGAASEIDELTIRWPSGLVDRWKNIPIDKQIIVEEGAPSWRVANTRPVFQRLSGIHRPSANSARSGPCVLPCAARHSQDKSRRGSAISAARIG